MKAMCFDNIQFAKMFAGVGRSGVRLFSVI
jgi:hypothetical protein